MPWQKSAADRKRDQQTYGPEYRRNRETALRRDGRKCVLCASRQRIQVDHVIPVTQGGTHAVENLRVLCGSCHKAKTATEGGGYRANGGKAAADPKPTPRTRWLA